MAKRAYIAKRDMDKPPELTYNFEASQSVAKASTKMSIGKCHYT